MATINKNFQIKNGLDVNGAVTATGGLIGNASTSSKLQTARTITLTGQLSGSIVFDGSSDITVPILLSESYNDFSNAFDLAVL